MRGYEESGGIILTFLSSSISRNKALTLPLLFNSDRFLLIILESGKIKMNLVIFGTIENVHTFSDSEFTLGIHCMLTFIQAHK